MIDISRKPIHPGKAASAARERSDVNAEYSNTFFLSTSNLK